MGRSTVMGVYLRELVGGSWTAVIAALVGESCLRRTAANEGICSECVKARGEL